jgi:hypothetical protein
MIPSAANADHFEKFQKAGPRSLVQPRQAAPLLGKGRFDGTAIAFLPHEMMLADNGIGRL